MNNQSGYIGLLTVLLVVGAIIFFILRSDLFSGSGGKSILQQNTDAVQKARDLKIQLETRDEGVSLEE